MRIMSKPLGARALFLLLLLAELVSYDGYFFPVLNTAGFLVITGVALLLSLQRLEYGLYFVLAELILGGKSGALLSLQYSGFFPSLRMALFIIVMAVWAGKVLFSHPARSPGQTEDPRQGRFFGRWLQNDILYWWGALGMAVLWGMAVGFLRGNNFGDLFLDANGYFYAALILPFVWVFTRINANRDEWARMLTRVIFAATTLLALKTLFAVYWFTHAGNNFIGANLIPFYRWVRDTGIGEITWLPGNFSRVFFQSHIYSVLAFFMLLAMQRRKKLEWALLALNATVIFVALSRSFWVGVIVGLIVFGIMQIRQIKQVGRSIAIAAIAALLILLVVARFPLPKPSPADLGEATRSRLAAGEAGQSRWNLLPPLTRAALKHPVLGSGFGTRVTYISNDPRIREVNPTGEYSTTAFEWGWMDLWLKLGLPGLIAYGGLLIAITRQLARRNLTFAVVSLSALAAIHIFTPYLNHPLGLGFLILFTVWTTPSALPVAPRSEVC